MAMEVVTVFRALQPPDAVPDRQAHDPPTDISMGMRHLGQQLFKPVDQMGPVEFA